MMALILEDARALLRTVIRSIDRKAEFSVAVQEGEQPGVAVTVVLRKHSTTVLVPADQMEEASRDSMRRSQLRTTLKRAIDRMMFSPTPIVGTKLSRPAVTDGGFFRTQQGFRSGRR
jgi:hypothetical protein